MQNILWKVGLNCFEFLCEGNVYYEKLNVYWMFIVKKYQGLSSKYCLQRSLQSTKKMENKKKTSNDKIVQRTIWHFEHCAPYIKTVFSLWWGRLLYSNHIFKTYNLLFQKPLNYWRNRHGGKCDQSKEILPVCLKILLVDFNYF